MAKTTKKLSEREALVKKLLKGGKSLSKEQAEHYAHKILEQKAKE